MHKFYFSVFLFFIGGCQLSTHAEEYPFTSKSTPRGEAKFFNSCTQSQHACRWFRLIKNNKGGFTSADIYAFPATETIAEMRINTPCVRVENISASVSLAGSHKEKEISMNKPKELNGGEYCEMVVPQIDGKKNSNGYNYIRLVQQVTAKDSSIDVNTVITFSGDAKNKIIIQSENESPLYMESNFIRTDEHGYSRTTKDEGGLIADFDSTPSEDLFIGISSAVDWRDFDKIYTSLSGTSIYGAGSNDNRDLDSALSEYAGYEFEYITDRFNAGAIPKLSPEKVIARHAGDCKDLTIVMKYLLAKHGIRSQPILMRTSRGRPVAPTMRVLPDYTWPNHVILFLPKFNVFLDPTLASGKYVVDKTYRAYGAIGINTSTSKFVIVGQE